MNTELQILRRSVQKWSKGLDRHYEKMDAIEDWSDKTKYQMSLAFVGARDVLISQQCAYIEALEKQLGIMEEVQP